jgi:hypothetical protein
VYDLPLDIRLKEGTYLVGQDGPSRVQDKMDPTEAAAQCFRHFAASLPTRGWSPSCTKIFTSSNPSGTPNYAKVHALGISWWF